MIPDPVFLIELVRDFEIEDLSGLRDAAGLEGFRFLERLADEWASGLNRFEGAGEGLWVARADGRLVGVGGLNCVPNDLLTGRLRRLYVLPDFRGFGVGRRLVETILTEGSSTFSQFLLRTDNPEADAFYLRLGFQRVELPDATHRRQT